MVLSAASVFVFVFFAFFRIAEAKTIDEYLTTPPRPVASLIFKDADGVDHALSDYRGKYVILNVWATWCSPCIKEMPFLDSVQNEFDPNKLVVLPVAKVSSSEIVSAYYYKYGIKNLPVLLDHTMRASAVLGIRVLPTTIFIDKKGDEILRIEGNWDVIGPDILRFLQDQTDNN